MSVKRWGILKWILSGNLVFCQLRIFFKIIFFKYFFQEYHLSVKQIGSRSGQTLCLA